MAPLPLLISLAQAQEPASDIRVLIDTSGSMKLNDPHNLRIPALKLLIELLPMGSRAGIWLFDAAPQALVPTGSVDAAWKAKALKAAEKIHSRGLFTHIEAALDNATQDWLPAAPESHPRDIVLLTDGMVDVSKQAEASTASRSRIVSEILPRLQMAGAHIDTIALSEQSDRELLRQLSLATDGWSETAGSAEALQRCFARLFGKVAPRDGLPLLDNRFKVDAGIEEFTVLALLRPDAKPTRLAKPDGGEITQAQTPPNTRWAHEPGFDLITVSHPPTGTWKLLADSDPDNRVLIVTHLKMEVTPIPNFVMPGNLPAITATFSEKGQPLDRQDFLNLLKVGASLADGAEPRELPMPQDPKHPGGFTLHLDPAPRPGTYTLTVTADGQTFQRQSTQTFHLMEDLVRVETASDTEAEPDRLIVTLTPNPGSLAPDSFSVRANLAGPGHPPGELNPERHEAAWRFSLPLPTPEGHGIVNFSATGKTSDGKSIAIPIKPLVLEGTAGAMPRREEAHPEAPKHPEPTPAHPEPTPAHPEPAPAHPEPAPAHPEPAPAQPEPASEHPEPTPAHPEPADPESAPSQPGGANWPITLAEAIGINIALLGAGYFLYRKIKQHKAATIAKLLGKLSP